MPFHYIVPSPSTALPLNKKQLVPGLFDLLWLLFFQEENKTILLKFMYSEKATKFCEIFTLLLTACTEVKSQMKILQNFVAFPKYMKFNQNFTRISLDTSPSFWIEIISSHWLPYVRVQKCNDKGQKIKGCSRAVATAGHVNAMG